jgi:hypothetical protein
VPSGVKLSREADGHGLTLRKRRLLLGYEMDLGIFGLECAFIRRELCPDE